MYAYLYLSYYIVFLCTIMSIEMLKQRANIPFVLQTPKIIRTQVAPACLRLPRGVMIWDTSKAHGENDQYVFFTVSDFVRFSRTIGAKLSTLMCLKKGTGARFAKPSPRSAPGDRCQPSWCQLLTVDQFPCHIPWCHIFDNGSNPTRAFFRCRIL